MAKIRVAADHDFKVRACLDYAHHSWNLHRNPKTAQIKPIADFFKGRCARLRALMELPAQVGNVTNKLRDTYMRSLFDVTGGLDANNVTPEQNKKIDLRSNEIFAELAEETLRLRKTAIWDAHVHENLIAGLVAIEFMGHDPHTVGMLQASMMSYVTTGWTIIETMSGDLWETALNAHPLSLANLTGSPKRLKGGQINKSSQAAKESKSVQLDDISRHRFDVANKMGTILRTKFEFASLDGIREAYACAFTERSAQIDRALIDKSLDALSAVRNVIVHRDAQADSEYIRKTKFLSSIPKAEIGQHVLLDGDVVVGLLKPAISAANQLLIAVDDWLANSANQV
jgi:hypothetical protein